MKQLRLSNLAVVIAALGFSVAPELTNIAANTAFAQEALRPEVGKVVQAAATLYKEKKFKEALNKIREADNIGGKSANETLTVERMRLSIASAAGDTEGTIRAAEAVLASNKVSGKDQLQLVQVLANSYFKAGNYAKAAANYQRYFAEGGTDQSLRQYLIQSLAQGGDSGKALKEVQNDIAADEKAGRSPSQANLEFIANVYLRQKDLNNYNATLEKLIVYYGKKEYWANLISGVQRKSTFNSRLSLDLYRLKLALGQINKAEDFFEFAQLALQARYPSEGIKIIDAGYKAGVLGTGKDADRHKRLRDLANSKLEETKAAAVTNEAEARKYGDNNALANIGYGYVIAGQYDKGIELLEFAIQKGNLRFPDDVKLHLGIAYLQAGKKPNALKVLKSVTGADGSGDIAHLWTIFTNLSK